MKDLKNLLKAVNNAWYEQMDIVNPDIRDFCFDAGLWSWEDIVDGEGNIVDSEMVITRKDLQECCDAIGIEFDCMNY